VLLVALVAVVRGSAVLARERAEAAADLGALAAADGIGVDGTSAVICARARTIAAANQARLVSCAVRLGVDGRTGTVAVSVSVRVRLAEVGAVVVRAQARAGRLGWSPAAEP
jgi:secretion/DNA translocation related TadE-like protein